MRRLHIGNLNTCGVFFGIVADDQASDGNVVCGKLSTGAKGLRDWLLVAAMVDGAAHLLNASHLGER
jgi:hypothetical protein